MKLADRERIIKALTANLDGYMDRIKKEPEMWQRWTDQAYGMTMGIGMCHEELFEDISVIWTEWRIAAGKLKHSHN